MSDVKAKMHKFSSNPVGETYSAPADLQLYLRGVLLRGMRGGKEGGRRGEERKGEKGRGQHLLQIFWPTTAPACAEAGKTAYLAPRELIQAMQQHSLGRATFSTPLRSQRCHGTLRIFGNAP